MLPPRLSRLALIIIAVAAVKGALLTFFIPPFQAPDEYDHYDYVLFLSEVPLADYLAGRTARPTSVGTPVTAELRALARATGTEDHLDRGGPVVMRRGLGAMFDEAAAIGEPDDPAKLATLTRLGRMVNYPPLYYLGQALLTRAARSAGMNPLARFYLARLASCALFLVTLVVFWRIVSALADSPTVAHLALALLAFQPQLGLLTISIQPDTLVLLLSALFTLAVFRWLQSPSNGIAALSGAWAGLLFLTKAHFLLPLAGAAAIVILLAHPTRQSIRLGVLAVAVAATIGSWWSVRSLAVLGNATGVIAQWQSPVDADWWSDLRGWFSYRQQLFRSYWGWWGWMDYGIGRLAQALLVTLCAIPAVTAVVGTVAARRTAGRPRFLDRLASNFPLQARVFLVLSFLLFVLLTAGLVVTIGPDITSQGRHWFPQIVPLTLYLAGAGALVSPRGIDVVRQSVARCPLAWNAAWWCSMALVVMSLGLVAISAPAPARLAVTLETPRESTAELYWDSGHGFNAGESSSRLVRRTSQPTTYRFPIRALTVTGLRFDPMGRDGSMVLHSLAIEDARGGLLARLGLDAVAPGQQVTGMEHRGDSLVLIVPTGAFDPTLLIRLDRRLRFEASTPQRTAVLVRRLMNGLARRCSAIELAWNWWPLWLALAIVLGAVGAATRETPPSARIVHLTRRGLAGVYVGVMVAINAHLAVLSWAFYYQ